MSSVFARSMTAYSAAARENPFLVNGGLGAAFAVLGDQLCQRFVEHASPTDKRRTLNIALVRFFFAMPWILFWFPILQQASPGTDHVSVAKRVLLDLSVGTPMMVLIVFFGTALLSGQLFQDPAKSVALFRQQFWATYKKGASFWSWFHFFITYRAPEIYRPLVSTLGGAYWNAVLSYGASRKVKSE